MKKFWSYISDVGCYPELDFEEKRRIRLLNRLNFISFLVLVIYLFVEIAIHVYVFIPYILFMLGLIAINFCMLKYRYYRLAKNFAVIIIALCISFFVLNTGNAFSEVLFVPLTAMPLIIFKDKRISIFYLFFLIALSFILRMIQPSIEPMLKLTEEEFFFFRAMNLINGIVITYFITYYFKLANESYESQLVNINEMVNEKNKEITDSINYAKHIQSAILPSQKFFKSQFRESFIIYKPKDIVAGDFYWIYCQGNHIYFAAADCTGHGVPGAMVSVICANALNRAVKEFNITDPGSILDKTRELVIETFSNENNSDTEINVKDGMDISLCSLNRSTKELQWSGANNPIWIFSERVLSEIKPDKQPVGKTDYPKPFTTHHIQLKENDSIYIFTDGCADQFGGEKGKKFKYSQFKALLSEMSTQPASEQSKKIEDTLNSWKGELEQVDDILVVGIRI